jgi:hypothetical protein
MALKAAAVSHGHSGFILDSEMKGGSKQMQQHLTLTSSKLVQMLVVVVFEFALFLRLFLIRRLRRFLLPIIFYPFFHNCSSGWQLTVSGSCGAAAANPINQTATKSFPRRRRQQQARCAVILSVCYTAAGTLIGVTIFMKHLWETLACLSYSLFWKQTYSDATGTN